MNRPKVPNYKFGFIPSGNTIGRSTALQILLNFGVAELPEAMVCVAG